ncbi:MAG TPA: hypothetical protein VMS18_01910 [Candidatus Binatia bacterium]|nr:hypothetical protein [Candidatus Binatia bacterium]
MKKLALVALLAVELVVCGCGASNNTSNETNTQATGNWEAQLTGGTDQAALLNFVTSFTVTNSGPLDITGFGFFNAGACFATGTDAENVTGNANFTTSSTTSVTGTLNLTIKSSTNGSVLTLNPGDLTGTSNGTTSTTGTLSNGVVVGTWSLTPGSGLNGCSSASGTYILCQDKATCTPTSAASAIRKPE